MTLTYLNQHMCYLILCFFFFCLLLFFHSPTSSAHEHRQQAKKKQKQNTLRKFSNQFCFVWIKKKKKQKKISNGKKLTNKIENELNRTHWTEKKHGENTHRIFFFNQHDMTMIFFLLLLCTALYFVCVRERVRFNVILNCGSKEEKNMQEKKTS